ncbi:hypothetical protein CEXT_780931 [Caerostris extrusa]|uniref:Uncharacterized protein n=1 Tax=Caerostris extrusa TaxID=172846 RepID=A0AAV4YC64_CAEEX|nr:hypothetical protein CEXT_780931 [Caerostris extrusa]
MTRCIVKIFGFAGWPNPDQTRHTPSRKTAKQTSQREKKNFRLKRRVPSETDSGFRHGSHHQRMMYVVIIREGCTSALIIFISLARVNGSDGVGAGRLLRSSL